MRLDTLAGSTTVDPDAALRFLRRWYKEDDLITLVAVREKKPGQPHLIAQVVSYSELCEQIESELDTLVNDEDGSQWNLYVQVCPALKALENPLKRGGDENVKTFRGVWVDLDVKPGSFIDEEAARAFLRGLAVLPTIVVATGSGGVHAYWKLEEDLSPEEGKKFSHGWWAYLAEEADKVGAKVDKLVDISRMMRLPGTVRWPKKGEQITPSLVRLIWEGGTDKDVEWMRGIAEGAADRRYKRILHVQQEDQQRKLDADGIARLQLSAAGGNRWALLQAISRIEEIFMELVSWDEILEPAGWTFIREDTRGRREWARPGRSDKSAVTDWPDSPDVMSLLSSSEETGLFDLLEAGIHLTKYRVALRFWFDDNETDMIDWVLKKAGL